MFGSFDHAASAYILRTNSHDTKNDHSWPFWWSIGFGVHPDPGPLTSRSFLERRQNSRQCNEGNGGVSTPLCAGKDCNPMIQNLFLQTWSSGNGLLSFRHHTGNILWAPSSRLNARSCPEDALGKDLKGVRNRFVPWSKHDNIVIQGCFGGYGNPSHNGDPYI